MISLAATLSSATSTRRLARRSGTTVPAALGSPTPSQAVKETVVPTSGSLSSPICPSIISTRRRQIVRPRPVPPCLRVVDMSPCVKGWNRRSACSRVMPMPVSLHRKAELAPLARRLQRLDPQPDLPVLGELDRIADQVGEDLPEAQGITHQALWHRGRQVRQELPAPFHAPSAR
jgi:hypothetical protein